jgi:hypothetical protein
MLRQIKRFLGHRQEERDIPIQPMQVAGDEGIERLLRRFHKPEPQADKGQLQAHRLKGGPRAMKRGGKVKKREESPEPMKMKKGGKAHLKKGSAAAKAFMAKLRSMRK